MSVEGTDVGEVTPAALAFGAGGAGDGDGEGLAGGDGEVADDEEFADGVAIGEDGGGGVAVWNGEGGGGFEIAADGFVLAGAVDFLLEEIADGLELGDGAGGFVGGEGRVGCGEVLFVDAVGVPGEFPCFVGGEGEDGSEEFGEVCEDLVHGGLGAAAARAVGRVAVEPILGDVDVEGAEVCGAELVEGDEDLAEVVGGVGGETVAGDGVEPLEDPAVEESEGVVGDGVFGGSEVVEIAEEDAERVAEAAVDLAVLFEELVGERDIVLPVDGGDPEADEVGAVFVIVVFCVDGFVAALADFLAGGVGDKAVGHDGLVWSGAAVDDAAHEGRLEPAAVLVGGFDVEVGDAAVAEFGA